MEKSNIINRFIRIFDWKAEIKVIFLFLLFFIILFLTTPTKKIVTHYPNSYTDYTHLRNIKNKTSHPMLTDYVNIGLNELGYTSCNINILKLPSQIQFYFYLNTGLKLNGLISKNIDNSYNIYVNNNLSCKELLQTLSHELIHLDQHQRKLIQINPNSPILKWRNKEYNTKNLKYDNRPWESDAKQRSIELNKRMQRRYLNYKKEIKN